MCAIALIFQNIWIAIMHSLQKLWEEYIFIFMIIIQIETFGLHGKSYISITDLQTKSKLQLKEKIFLSLNNVEWFLFVPLMQPNL